MPRWLASPASSFTSLPLIVRLCVVAWLLTSVAGGLLSLRAIPPKVAQAAGTEFDRRQSTWARTYGFGAACEPRLLDGSHVMLVNPALGPGEIPEPVLAIDPDATHFGYSLMPRTVSVQWDLSSTWLPQAGDADYIALWQSKTNPSVPQQGAVLAERAALDGLLGSNVVCSYTDDLGSQGTIYALSPLAVAAIDRGASPTAAVSLAAPLARPYDSLVSLGRAYLGIVSLWLIGLLLLALLIPRGLNTVLRVSLAFPLGCLAAVAELAIFSLLRISWSVPALALPWLVLLGLALVLRRGALRESIRSFALPRLSGLEAGLVLALAAGAALLFAVAPFGLAELDGFTAVYFKARVFDASAGILPYFEHAHDFFYSHPTHPPFSALAVDWLYQAVGGVHEHASLILWPALLTSLVGVMYGLLRSVTSRRTALLCAAAFAFSTTQIVGASMQYGYSDLPLALFLLSGIGLLWLWVSRSDVRWPVLLLAGLFLAGAAWIKEEGIIVGPLACVLVVVLGRMLRMDRAERWFLAPAAFVLAYAVAIAPLMVLKVAYPAPEIIIHGAGLANATSRLPVIVIGFTLRGIQHWFLPAIVLVLAVWQLLRNRSVLVRSLLAPKFWLPLLVVAVQLAADTAAIAVNTMDVYGEMGWAGGRLLLQLTSLVYLAVLTLWLTALRAPAPAVSEPEPAQVALQPAATR